MYVPSARPNFEGNIENILKDIHEVLKSGRLILGPYTRRFEQLFSEYTGVKYAIGVSSCTSALEIVLRYLEVKEREVIIQTNAFVTCANSVIYAGGEPVFSDIKRETFNMDPEDVSEKITPKTKAIMAVHIAGLPVPEIDVLKEICEDHNLFLIEDASHAHGAMIDDRRVGSIGDVGCFSLYPTKIMTTCTGGMITTNDEKLLDFAVSVRHYGSSETLEIMRNFGNDWLMNEISAVIGIYQLKRLEDNIKRRNEIARRYMKGLDKIDNITYFPVPENVRHGYYKFLALLDEGIDKEKFRKTMRTTHNVEIGSLYPIPCHLQPIYRQLGYKEGSCPVAEDTLTHQISLPMFHQMTDEEVDYVLDCLARELKK